MKQIWNDTQWVSCKIIARSLMLDVYRLDPYSL